MGILDELKKLTHPYDDEDEEYEDFEEPRERSFDDRRNKAEDRRNKVVNIHATTQLKVVLVKPDRFENASEIADQLKDKRTVVLNLNPPTRMWPGGSSTSFPAWPMPARARSKRLPQTPTSSRLTTWNWRAISSTSWKATAYISKQGGYWIC